MSKTTLPLMQIKPMLAIHGDLFDSDEYLYEIKWDGYRSIVYLEGQTWLQSRNLKDLGRRFPELTALHQWVKKQPAVLDGEIITLVDGKPAFQPLLARDRLRDSSAIKRASSVLPAIFVAFDVLYREGRNVTGEPLEARRAMLEEMVEESQHINTSRFVIGRGTEFFKAICDQKLEGMVAKNRQSPYVPGRRTPYWIKIKSMVSRDFVIIGYNPSPEGGRTLGSLLLGAYESGNLVFMGHVGTGFSDKEKEYLLRLMDIIQRSVSPVTGLQAKGARWVEPLLVCTVEYLERTADGKLRHPSYKGLRSDKKPAECVVEDEG